MRARGRADRRDRPTEDTNKSVQSCVELAKYQLHQCGWRALWITTAGWGTGARMTTRRQDEAPPTTRGRFPALPQHVVQRDGVREAVREFLIVGLGMLIYFGVRGITQGSREQAFRNARWVANLEQHLHMRWETWFQDPLVAHGSIATFANWIYIYGHWPVIISALVLLQRYRPDRFWLLRTAMFISGVIGFAFFLFTPMAPPRFVDPFVMDTVTQRSSGYRVLQPPQIANLYASMPSLHAGWNMLVGVVVFGATRNVLLRIWSIVFPMLMAWAVVATGNHYVIDVVMGEIVAITGYFAAILLRRRRAAILQLRDQDFPVSDRPSGGK